ncbi:hypothetical protein M422DRAFT_254404 [Sphaerobolus stellatus SS14]|uniref:Unplaced genomic scaffold SPHSTscaffold_55, whole genome shotgun sequence n=1 Tax=Sphaerobolus stellatus (strain SS14) TaxID=990650 RepID=A0A0C9UH12_SPHS4|nr:hypothetical protein M422DRAFT_254404 [Sphaerobolus stellatus SS14]
MTTHHYLSPRVLDGTWTKTTTVNGLCLSTGRDNEPLTARNIVNDSRGENSGRPPPLNPNHITSQHSTSGGSMHGEDACTADSASGGTTAPDSGTTSAEELLNSNGPPQEGSQRNQNKEAYKRKRLKPGLRIGTLNIRGAGSDGTQDKWNHMNQVIRDNQIGILTVQETHLSNEKLDSLNRLFERSMQIISSEDHTRPNSKGVAILLNKRLVKWEEAKSKEIISGRAILLTLPWVNQPDTIVLNILAIYAPNDPKESETFWNKLKEKGEQGTLPTIDIILGDFNVIEEAIDRLPSHPDNENTANLPN